jgi:hypothetical protein
MSFASPDSSGPQSHIMILCPACGAVGQSVWEDEKGGPYLVNLSDGFYERLARRQPYDLEIVCKGCGTAQAERRPSRVSNDAGVSPSRDRRS